MYIERERERERYIIAPRSYKIISVNMIIRRRRRPIVTVIVIIIIKISMTTMIAI